MPLKIQKCHEMPSLGIFGLSEWEGMLQAPSGIMGLGENGWDVVQALADTWQLQNLWLE